MRSKRLKIPGGCRLVVLASAALALLWSPVGASHMGVWNQLCDGGANVGQSCSADTDCPGASCLNTQFDFKIVAINMVHLHTGKILLWENPGEKTSARVWNFWDPETNWYASDAFKSSAFTDVSIERDSMFCAGQAPLADGRVLIVGGHNPKRGNHIGLVDTNIFDPARFDPDYVPGVSPAGDSGWVGADGSGFPPGMVYRRWYPTVTTLPDGRMLTVSGSNRVCDGGANNNQNCVTDQGGGLTTSSNCPLNNTGTCDLQSPVCNDGGQACSSDEDCPGSICVGTCSGGDDAGKVCQETKDCQFAFCKAVWQRLPEIYDPFDGPKGSWSTLVSADKSIAFYPFDYVVPNGAEKNIVVMAGAEVKAGENESPIKTWILDVDNNNNWQPVADSCFNDNGVTRCFYGASSVMYEPGKIFKSGGVETQNGTFDTFHTTLSGIIDVSGCDDQACGATWQRAADMHHGRIRHNLTLLPDGKILCTGGSNSDENSDMHVHGIENKEAELYDPVTDDWDDMATMLEERMYHSSALLLPDGRVLSAGSGQGSDADENIRMAEIFSPPYLFTGKPRPTIDKAPDLVFYRDRFRVETGDTSKIGQVTLMRLAAVTHAFDENQRRVPLGFTDQGDHLEVVAPDNATYAPPGWYMLFLVAKDSEGGVPSIAKYVRIPFQKTVWVDFNHAGTEEGSFSKPFDTLAEGVAAVQPGGLVRVKTGTTVETPVVKKPLVIRSYAGSAEVGEN